MLEFANCCGIGDKTQLFAKYCDMSQDGDKWRIHVDIAKTFPVPYKRTFGSNVDPQDYHNDCQTCQFIPNLLQNLFQFSHKFRPQSAAIFSTVHSLIQCTPNSQIWDLCCTVIWREIL
jgi:hypothetical protein